MLRGRQALLSLRSKCLSSHSSFSQQGERKHQAKRISPNPCWFFFFFGLKRGPIGAKCPQLDAKWALCNLFLIVSGFGGLFVSLKASLFVDEILMICGAGCRSPQPWGWALPMNFLMFFKVKSPWKRTINSSKHTHTHTHRCRLWWRRGAQSLWAAIPISLHPLRSEQAVLSRLTLPLPNSLKH